MTTDDLPAAFATVPAAWRAVLPGWTTDTERTVVQAIRRVSANRPIGPDDPFRALRWVAPADVRVLIVGQDPYPTPGQADGMAFSAARVSARPSLRRIFEVLEADRPGWKRPVSGRLDAWAAQGVLLLNTALTVEWGRAGSHLQVGWQALTSEIVIAVQAYSTAPVAMTWGSHARTFFEAALQTTVETSQTFTVLNTRHPSNDFQRGFMQEGSHFAATAELVDWWAIGNAAGG